MADVRERIQAEKENIKVTLTNLKKVLRRKRKTVIELSAIGSFLNNIYNGVENILKQALLAKIVKIQQSDFWHKDLINLSVSQKLISQKTANQLFKYLSFRHFFVHGYAFTLKEKQLMYLANDVSEIWSKFIQEVENSL
jgi:uncharacterized protein YutE (UPF0331/DUF86 family)